MAVLGGRRRKVVGDGQICLVTCCTLKAISLHPSLMIKRCFAFLLLLTFLFTGCNNQPPAPNKAEASPTPVSSPTAVASASPKTPFSIVTAQLDSEGGLYYYCEIDKILAQITKGIIAARDATILSGKLTPEQSAEVKQQFNLVLQLFTSSGLSGLQAVGGSSKQESVASYLTKSIAFAPAPTGFLWATFCKQPHSFDVIDFVPANTEAFAFSDFDLSGLWNSLAKDLTASQIPAAVQFVQEFPKQVVGATGMQLSEILASLGDQAGYIVTLDPNSKVQIPIAGGEQEISEPAAAILWKVRDEKLFNMLEALAELSQDVATVDEPDLKLRIINMTGSLPYLRPTLARFADYLVFSSNDKLVRALKDTKSGKVTGLRTRTDFAKISKGLPDNGNSLQYVSKQFQSAYYVLQEKQLASSNPGDRSPVSVAGLKSLATFLQDYESYSVLSRTDNGFISFTRGNKDLADILGQLVVLPIYYLGDILAGREKEHGLSEPSPNPTNSPEPSLSPANSPEPGATPTSATEPSPTPSIEPSPTPG
jgi:hypothetical protein